MGFLLNSLKAAQQLSSAMHNQNGSDGSDRNQEPVAIDTDNEFIIQNNIWTPEQIQSFDESVTKVYNERVELYIKRRKTRASLIALLITGAAFTFVFLIALLFAYLAGGSATTVAVVLGAITLILALLSIKSVYTLSSIKDQLAITTVSLDLSSVSEDVKEKFNRCVQAWKDVYASDAVYYIMSAQELSRTQQVKQRTTAGTSVNRVSVNSKISFLNKFLSNMGYDPFIETCFEPIVASTRGNGALVIYPGFVVAMYDNKLLEPSRIKVYSWEGFRIKKSRTTFIEPGFPPKDAKVVSYTYEHANIDGSMDRRYSSNRQIPVMEYGEIEFNNMGTIYEYMISNFAQSQKFYEVASKLK